MLRCSGIGYVLVKNKFAGMDPRTADPVREPARRARATRGLFGALPNELHGIYPGSVLQNFEMQVRTRCASGIAH